MNATAVAATTERPSRARAILLDILGSYGRQLLDIVAMLVLTPLIISLLGQRTFGLWALIWAMVGLFELLDLGLAAGVVKYVAAARGRGDVDGQRQVVSTLFWVYAALGAVLLAGVGACAIWIESLVGLEADQVGLARAVLLILGARLALCMPLGMFRGVLAGHQMLRVADGYKALATIGYFVSVVLVLTQVPDIRVLALLNLIAGVWPMVAMARYAQRTLPGATVALDSVRLSLIPTLASFSVFILLMQISRQIYVRLDALIIAHWLPLELVAIYAIAMQLASRAQMVCSQPNRALTPLFAELHAADDRPALAAAWLRGSKLAIACSAPLLLGLALMAEPLIVGWIGPDFAGAALALQLLTAAAFVGVAHGSTLNLLSMTGRERYLAVASIAGQIGNIVLSIVLIVHHGIVGVAAATLIVNVVVNCLVLQPRAARAVDSTLARSYVAALLPAVLPALACGAFILACLRAGLVTGLIGVALVELLAVLVFGLVYWATALDAAERQAVLRAARRKIKKKKR